MPYNKFSGSVDEILEGLNARQSKESNQAVEDILADLGMQTHKPAPEAPQPEAEHPGSAGEFQQPAVAVMSFWNGTLAKESEDGAKPQQDQPKKRVDRTAQAETPRPRKGGRAGQKPGPVEQTQEIKAPRLSETIQMDSEFQKFFSESVAVIPDLKNGSDQEEHPGFFARFVRGKKAVEETVRSPENDQDEGLYSQEEYSVEQYETQEIPLVYQEPERPKAKQPSPKQEPTPQPKKGWFGRKKQAKTPPAAAAPQQQPQALAEPAAPKAEPKAAVEQQATGTILLEMPAPGKQQPSAGRQPSAWVDEPTGTIRLEMPQQPEQPRSKQPEQPVSSPKQPDAQELAQTRQYEIVTQLPKHQPQPVEQPAVDEPLQNKEPLQTARPEPVAECVAPAAQPEPVEQTAVVEQSQNKQPVQTARSEPVVECAAPAAQPEPVEQTAVSEQSQNKQPVQTARPEPVVECAAPAAQPQPVQPTGAQQDAQPQAAQQQVQPVLLQSWKDSPVQPGTRTIMLEQVRAYQAQQAQQASNQPLAQQEPAAQEPPLQQQATQSVESVGQLTQDQQEEPELAGSALRQRLHQLVQRLPRLFGAEPEEGEEEQGQSPFTAQPASAFKPLEEYENLGDAPLVEQDLKRMRFAMTVRTSVAAVVTVILFYLGLAVGQSPLPPITALDPAIAPGAFLLANLILLLAACGVNWRVFYNGVLGLRGEPSPDTLPALAALGAVVQLLAALPGAQEFDAQKVTLFAAPAALILCMSALGKWVQSTVILKDFLLMTTATEQVAAVAVEDEELCQELGEGLGEPQPHLLVNRPTALFRNFLARSFSVRSSDGMQQKISWVLAGAAVLAALITLVSGNGLFGMFTVLAGTLCLGAPLASTLMSAVPLQQMHKSASRFGAVVPGWQSVEQVSQTNMVVVSARDLFPAKSVRLHGIKTFEKERIDLAILYAASILVPGCDTLRNVFLNIIQGRTEILYPAENLENEPGLGFTAWVDGKRMIVGNRAMMAKQGVELPSLDYENRYTKGEKQPIYLAVSGRLFGMFLVSYRADEQAAAVLENLHHQGISVLLKSDDFSLTGPLVAQIYQMPEDFIKVLNAAERHALSPLVTYQQSTEGCICHLGSFASFVGGMLAAGGAASAQRISSRVLAAGVLLSAVLALMLAFTGGVGVLALPVLLVYQAAWAVLTLAIPLIKKY